MLKKLILPFICCSFLLGLAQDSQAERILRRNNESEPQSLYAPRASDIPSYMILRDLYEGLVIYAKDGSLLPGTAEKWEIDQTGTIYTFHIRPNAKWSNGDPVTAHDFEFGWKHIVDPKTASTYAFILKPIKNADEIVKGVIKDLDQLGVKALDDKTLQITLNAPTAYFLNALVHHSFYPFHKASYEKYKDAVSKPGNLVSNGAFLLSEWRPQDYIMIAKNPHYWDHTNVKLDKVQFFATEDQNTVLKNYRSGQLDLTYEIKAEKLQFVKRDKELVKDIRSSPELSIYYYGINLRDPILGQNKDLREALSLVIDRDKIVNNITLGGEIPAYGFVPPRTSNAKNMSLEFQALSMEDRIKRAKELFEKAGYGPKNPLKIDFSYNTNDNHKKIAVAIMDMWKHNLPGVEVNLRNLEWKVFLQERNEGKNTQIYRSGWVGDYNDPNSFLEMFRSGAGLNHSGYNSQKFDNLLDQGAKETDLRKRADILAEAEKDLLENHAVLPIYFYVRNRLVKPWVKGYEISGSNLLDIFYSKDLEIQK